MKKLRSLLSPMPLKPGYADAADFLRVMCVFLISWFHIWQQSWLNPNIHIGSTVINIYPLVTCGYMFVDAMLLISGFLLMLGYLSRPVFDRRAFYTARAARILPAYLVCLVILFLFNVLPQIGSIGDTNLTIDLLAHLTFTHNLFPESYVGTHLNGVLWTLAVEVQFYILFPFIAESFRKKPAAVWALMTGAAFLSRWYVNRYYTDTSLYFNRLPAMLDVYANGMLAAMIFHRLSKTDPSVLRGWISTALTVVSCVGFCHILKQQRMLSDYDSIRRGQMYYRFMLSVNGSVFLVCGSRSVALVRHLLSNRLVRLLSSFTYSYYMLHQFLACKLKDWHIPAYEGTSPNVDGIVSWQVPYTLLCFACALLAAVLMRVLVEKPGAGWIKKLLAPRKKLESGSEKC